MRDLSPAVLSRCCADHAGADSSNLLWFFVEPNLVRPYLYFESLLCLLLCFGLVLGSWFFASPSCFPISASAPLDSVSDIASLL